LDEFGAYLSPPEILTGQQHTSSPDSSVQEWKITPTFHPPYTTDVIILKRDIVGAFQPSRSRSPLTPPGLDPCRKQFVGFSLRNSVGTAQLMVTTSPGVPSFKFGSALLYAQIGLGQIQAISAADAGEAKIFNEHNIYWYVRPDFIRKITTGGQDARLVLTWEWDPYISSGPSCRLH
jgi:hypothetical protein